jgi:hypothetical protein
MPLRSSRRIPIAPDPSGDMRDSPALEHSHRDESRFRHFAFLILHFAFSLSR